MVNLFLHFDCFGLCGVLSCWNGFEASAIMRGFPSTVICAVQELKSSYLYPAQEAEVPSRPLFNGTGSCMLDEPDT